MRGGKTEATSTICPYCGVGCGVQVTPHEGGFKLSGNGAHPANLGRLCSKGAALAETLGAEGRLLHPEIGGRRVDWDEALAAVADGFRDVLDRYGPEAVAFYVSGQLLTEDYYVANKLMKGFIGGANIDTNSRLCMASTVAGHKRAFGADLVPGCYEDLELADLVVLVGSNAAWCHPVLYQRIQTARERSGARLVVIDPRRTDSCEDADLHLPIRPGSDIVLFNGLLDYLRREDRLDWSFLEAHTEGFAAALEAARSCAPSIPEVARTCGLAEDAVARFYRWFAATPRTVTAFSQGVNQSAGGTDKVNAILNVHLASGRIGRPGCGPFSLTGQPNAMGGREVGGLANTLAAHMGFEDPADVERVARFWKAPHIATRPGLKAVELFEAVRSGRIKALWIIATNPAVSLPDADTVTAALAACPLVVVSDCVRHTDTTAHADVLLPAAAWGEKSGTVTNSERRISRQRGFVSAPGEARPDWWAVTQVARRLGYAEAFPYSSPAAIFREHARLSGFENGGRRAFDIGGLATLSDAEYEALAPVQWPIPAASPGGTARLLGDGRFYTDSGKARLVPVAPPVPVHPIDAEYPLLLNTGRVRDQWHTMTRTGRVARLGGHTPEPSVTVHPQDGARMGLVDGALASVESRWGDMLARVHIDPRQAEGSLFVPIHWSGPFAARGRVGALVHPVVDPISGQPDAKLTPARVRPWRARWYGFVLARKALQLPPETSYWVRARGEHHWRHELAGTEVPDWQDWSRALFGKHGEWLEFADTGAGRYRGAVLRDGRLTACIFIAAEPRLPERSWLGSLFALPDVDGPTRAALLSGQAPGGRTETGATVCACMNVGRETIRTAIRRDGLNTAEAVGQALGAGTQCGACRPEIRRLLADAHDEYAA